MLGEHAAPRAERLSLSPIDIACAVGADTRNESNLGVRAEKRDHRSVACAITIGRTTLYLLPTSSCEDSHDESCHFRFGLSAADQRRGRPSWLGRYDANKPVTITGPILSSKFENPHATITVRASDKVWTVTLAPTSRMSTRGATEKVVAVGQDVSAYGYPSTVEKDEMRAERITVNGKTYEMR